MKKYKYQQRSYLARRLERRGRKRFLLTIIILVIFIYLFLSWVLPNLISSLTFLNKYKDSTPVQKPVSETIALTPPIFSIPFEATSSAQIIIKGYSTPQTRVEIYLDETLVETADVKTDGSFISGPIDLNLGNNNFFGKTIDERGTKSLPSKGVKVFYSNEKPKLDVREPQDNQAVKDKSITVSGSTDAGKDIEVTINSTRVIVSSDGNFSKSIELTEGENEIKVKAQSSVGNFTEIIRKIILEPTPTSSS